MKLEGLYSGTVLQREDPDNAIPDGEVLGRVTVNIPGEIEETAWAWPRGAGGAEKFGRNFSPPVGAAVLVQFVNGDSDHPVWELDHHAIGQTFPEFVHPDVMVMGTEHFRFVHDTREGQRYAALRALKQVGDNEETLIEIRFDIERNMLLVHGETGLALNTRGQLEVLSRGGDVEIQRRKVIKTKRTI